MALLHNKSNLIGMDALEMSVVREYHEDQVRVLELTQGSSLMPSAAYAQHFNEHRAVSRYFNLKKLIPLQDISPPGEWQLSVTANDEFTIVKARDSAIGSSTVNRAERINK